MSKWISIKKRLPPLDRVVMVCYRSGYDGGPVYGWGARLDEGEGWLWGVQTGYSNGIRLGQDATWNSIEADDDYKVTHWQTLPAPPFRLKGKPNGTLRIVSHVGEPPRVGANASYLTSTRFDEVKCDKLGSCEWPECECRRKELRGTFACPICGESTPHHHSTKIEKRDECSGCMNPACEDCFD